MVNQKALLFFQSLADETRLRIVECLLNGEMTVNKIHKKVNNISLSAVSHQLKLLYNLGVIEFQKKGREKYVKLSRKYCWCILKKESDHFKKGKCKICGE